MHFHWIFVFLVSLVSGIIVPSDPRIPYMFPPGYGTLQQDDQDNGSAYSQAPTNVEKAFNYPYLLEELLRRQQRGRTAQSYYFMSQNTANQLAIDYNRVNGAAGKTVPFVAPHLQKRPAFMTPMPYTY
ncbi:uncharacterized protein LOC106670194 [Cimex lectularius]|uniref:CPR type cuticle protein n=1 Tax=Cimex lectularius TaxID=79782 RepID=A0A8I6S276_CIMLE|nr:uncharacterized protein LOC106670194 [Cimex lectularius]